jgi:hypothetical protein
MFHGHLSFRESGAKIIAKLARRQSESPGTWMGSNRSTAALRSNRFNRLMKQLGFGSLNVLNYLTEQERWSD